MLNQKHRDCRQWISNHRSRINIDPFWSIPPFLPFFTNSLFSPDPAVTGHSARSRRKRAIRGQGHAFRSAEYDGPSADLLTDLEERSVSGWNVRASTSVHPLYTHTDVASACSWSVRARTHVHAALSETVIGQQRVHGWSSLAVSISRWCSHSLSFLSFFSHECRLFWPADFGRPSPRPAFPISSCLVILAPFRHD